MAALALALQISIHALRAEGDAGGSRRFTIAIQFLSTPSVRRATRITTPPSLPLWLYFYPRPPCGGRLLGVIIHEWEGIISIHALRAEGDMTPAELERLKEISIHALRAEGDSKSSQNIVCFCSTNTKIRRSDITKTHTLCFYQNYFVLFYIIFQLSFGAKVPVLFCALHVRTRYSSSTSSCDHCGQRPICSTFFL